MTTQQKFIRRGTHLNPTNRFDKKELVSDADFLEHCFLEEEWLENDETEYLDVFPKSIVNKVDSPDVPFNYSINPYQGCEHGCIYCYARNSHEFWGYNAGSDFERKIMVKRNAPELLKKRLTNKSWEVSPIMLSGNTDCYQPAEAKFKLTRRMLQLFLKYKHPVGILTKNSLILRDIDIIKELAKLNLIHVGVSITSMNDEVRKKLEPRTASIAKRFRVVQELSKVGVPVNVMFAPVIPGITSHEIIPLMNKAAALGASKATFIPVRLNGQNEMLFSDWLDRHFPERKDKVLNLIKEMHGGKVSNNRFKERMTGKGKWSEMLKSQFKFAQNRFFKGREYPAFDLSLFQKNPETQLSLF